MEFSPLIMAHGARLTGAKPWEVFDAPDLLIQAQKAVLQTYDVAELTAGVYPLCLEGEAYGARIHRSANADLGLECVEPLVEEFEEILDIEPFDPQSDGRFSDFLEAARALARELTEPRVYVPVSGPFTVAAQLMGAEEFLSQFMDDQELGMEALEHLVDAQQSLCEEICLAGLGVRIIETQAALPEVEQEAFHDFAVPLLHKLVARTRSEAEIPVILHLAGDIAPVAESLVEIGPHILICPPATDAGQLFQALHRLNQNGNGYHYPHTVRVDIPGDLFLTVNRARLESWLKTMLPVLKNAPLRSIQVGTTALPAGAEPDLVKLATTHVTGA